MSESFEFMAPSGERTIVTGCVVSAPPSNVFEAWTNPEQIARWWGPYILTMVICEVDLRTGGRWRFVERSREGHEFEFRGEYKEILRPGRIVHTFVFDGMPEAEALQTVTFDDADGRTRIRSTIVHTSVEARDRQVAWPLRPGLVESYERLDRLLASRPA